MDPPLLSALFVAGILGEGPCDPGVSSPNTFAPLAAAPQLQGHLMPSGDWLLLELLLLSQRCVLQPRHRLHPPLPKGQLRPASGHEKGPGRSLENGRGNDTELEGNQT